MSLVKRFKWLVRMFGHALVVSVHDRLSLILQQNDSTHARLDRLNAAVERLESRLVNLPERLEAANGAAAGVNSDLAEIHRALLHGSIHMIEQLESLRGDLHHVRESLPEIVEHSLRKDAALAELNDLVPSIRTASAGLGGIEPSIQRHFSDLSLWAQGIQRQLECFGGAPQVCVETSDYEFTHPEVALMMFLYSHLPSRKAIDVGANRGEVSERLLDAGYEVYAFEPSPCVYGLLTERLARRAGFHPFQLALGSSDAVMPLHLAHDGSGGRYADSTNYSSLVLHSMPDDLPFAESIPVTVRTLAELHRAGDVPADIGLLKIDTEGFDLEVIRGLGDYRHPIVSTEFWDKEIPFARSGAPYTLETLIGEMRQRGYFWHITLYHIWSRNEIGYYSNHPRAVPNSWGNTFFFNDRTLFEKAQDWCAAVLPKTYFRAAPSGRT